MNGMSEGERRLAAIMFTDMVGYTALGQRDEALSIELADEQSRLIRPILARQGGREVKTIGDAFLVEFPSALNAVTCAVEIQRALKRSNESAPPDRRLTIRVGIHLGDVVHRGDDVFGDAVNVASRIEPLAPPGGVCVSSQVYQSVVNKVDIQFDSLGTPELKNVSVPIEVYQVSGLGEARPRPAQKGAASMGRLAVLPFDSFSPDPSDEYFADGMTEELIDRIAQLKELRVISRTSVMGYKKKEMKATEIGKELGVGMLVEGSVRKTGNRIRITVQLIDAGTEEHIWSERYDRELDDVFAVQTDIANRVTEMIQGRTKQTVHGPPTALRGQPETGDMKAYTAFLQGRKLLWDKASEDSVKQGLALFEEAVRLDPNFARARVGVAEALLWLGTEGAAPFDDSERRAREELGKALELNPSLAEAHSALAALHLGADDIRGSEREAKRAIELNPSLSDPYRWLAQIESGNGRIGEAVRLLETAQEVNPVDINVLAFLGRAYVYAGRDSDALAHWERTMPLVPYRTNAHMSEYYLGIGDLGRAEEKVSELERLRPNSAWTVMYRGYLSAMKGDREGARRALERLEARGRSGEMTVFFEGFVHYALGEEDAFVACMEEAFRRHNLPLLELMYSRLFEKAKDDPRIADLLRRQFALSMPEEGEGGRAGT
jgi:adenylate cyclase